MDDSSRHCDYYSVNFRFLTSIFHRPIHSVLTAESMSDTDHLSVKKAVYPANQEEHHV